MSLSFTLWSFIAVLVTSFCIGTGMKLWIHRHRAFIVILSPIWCMLLLIVIPVFTISLILFMPEKFDDAAKRSPKVSQISFLNRVAFGLSLWVAFVRYYPIVLAAFATIMSFIQNGLKVSQKASKVYESIVDVACQYANGRAISYGSERMTESSRAWTHDEQLECDKVTSFQG